MFRLFLIKLIEEGGQVQSLSEVSNAPLPPSRLRNRRIYERFDVDHKQLTLMNGQNILLVRDMSLNGFSTEVSKTCFNIIKKGDVYDSKLRYLGEIYDLKVVVKWKSKGFIGFNILNSSKQLETFINRILEPIDIALSMKEMKSFDELKSYHGSIQNFQGLLGTKFFIAYDEEDNLKTWRLEMDTDMIQWSHDTGIETGSVQVRESLLFSNELNHVHLDEESNPYLQQRAVDIFMALKLPIKEKLIDTIIGEDYGISINKRKQSQF